MTSSTQNNLSSNGVNINYYTGSKPDLREVVKLHDVQRFDEALCVCDLSKVQERYQFWRKYLPRIRPFYAVKCNNDEVILQTLVNLGTGFDCASLAEIQQIVQMHVQPNRIIFANPCKPISHIIYAKQQQVAIMTVDNEEEINKIAKYFPEANLVIRIRCDAKDAQCPLGDKFGCDSHQEAKALMLLAKSLQMNIVGISFHVGSGCRDYPAYGRAISASRQLFNFGQCLGYQMYLLDIGGGFPGDNDAAFKEIVEVINSALESNFPCESSETIEIIAEPGRFFVASACTLICKIHAKRILQPIKRHKPIYNNSSIASVPSEQSSDLEIPSKETLTRMYYLNDGVYGSFNAILYDHQQIKVKHLFPTSERKLLPLYRSVLWGPSCDALDQILENVMLPDLSCGDLLVFPNMGAYTLPIASPFNGFPVPKLVYYSQKLSKT